MENRPLPKVLTAGGVIASKTKSSASASSSNVDGAERTKKKETLAANGAASASSSPSSSSSSGNNSGNKAEKKKKKKRITDIGSNKDSSTNISISDRADVAGRQVDHSAVSRENNPPPPLPTTISSHANNSVHVMVAGGVKPAIASSSSSSSLPMRRKKNVEMELISLNDETLPTAATNDLHENENDATKRQHENKTPFDSGMKMGQGKDESHGTKRGGSGAYHDRVDGRNTTGDDDNDEEEGDGFVSEEIDDDDDDETDGDEEEHEKEVSSPEDLYDTVFQSKELENAEKSKVSDLLWLSLCFFGIMISFVCYGLLLEYTTSGGRKLHELSFLFVTSALYTVTAATGRYVRDETPSSIPPARFAILGLTSMGSTFCSVRSLRYVIYPIQVLAKSCKPVPVMIMGAFMGKKYPLKKYINVILIVGGVAMFMGGGDDSGSKKHGSSEEGGSSPSQVVGITLLFISLCFDGGTGAYEDKLMSVHSVGPFDLMYNIQLGKTILAGIGLLVLNQVHVFMKMIQEMGFLLIALGLSGALGQVFIFVTISKFGALTCSIIGLARKVTTLVASIYFYGHHLNGVQFTGLLVCIMSMIMNFWGKSSKGGHGHGHGTGQSGGEVRRSDVEEEQIMLSKESHDQSNISEESGDGDVELKPIKDDSAAMV